MNDLERKLNTSVDVLEETIASVNLSTHTSTLYQEKLLYKLKNSLFDTLSRINQDKCCPCKSKDTALNVHDNAILCDHCGESFDSNSKFMEHFQTVHHEDFGFPCSNCDKVFIQESSFNYHVENEHYNTPVVGQLLSQHCPPTDLSNSAAKSSQCDKVYNTSYDQTNHIGNDHSIQAFQCSECCRTFDVFNDLCMHLQ